MIISSPYSSFSLGDFLKGETAVLRVAPEAVVRVAVTCWGRWKGQQGQGTQE